MYNPILAKSFSHYERKTFGCCAFVLFLIVVFSSCMVFKNHLYPQSVNGDAMNLQISMNAAEDMFVIKDTTLLKKLETEKKDSKPMCNVLEPLSDYCETKGDIRVQGNSSTIFVVMSHNFNISTENNSWTIQPYPRKGNSGAMSRVKSWTVKLVQDSKKIPKCSVYHGYPAVLFSLGGYSGNHFHDFSDLLVPIFSNSRHFNSEVHFLATDYKSWWIGKYKTLLNNMSKNKILDIDNENEVHCFPSVTTGLKSHKEFGIDSSKFPNGVSMLDFRQFLRRSFSLNRIEAIKMKGDIVTRPRLLIMSRKKSRILLNEGDVRRMSEDLGYEVVLAEANLSTNLSKFAQIVNSCDVIMGVHGAGLTNMVFLPNNAVLIQLVPLGAMDYLAKRDFGDPAGEMNIKYFDYKIGVNESSLVEQYPPNHKVFKDPSSFHRKGWGVFRSIYLDKQNVKVDLNRFRSTLLKAKKLLATS
ncbi:alpha-1,3-arabinosyltransferase XAT2-like [Solanum dulcamara]|uniref:alpha-1,3-arabinosyltransferase XAT2-like n=1 Tax=Solanum dulcamara TaxID=45834 RepID=UPI002484D7B1|nr:alpha-1,3-arabinosyltransferase XAT2-like [Solanum dulcamara]